ncbi:MAG: aspartate aminotransferase family protein [Rhodospirillales bacterium]|nr:aspartate aminotransferase family protein [Rhodospirillales bacterium]
MDTQEMLEKAQSVFVDLYPLQDIVLDRGEGCCLFDTDGKRYLDFAAGIAVASLGHAHPVFIKAVEEQIRCFTTCPGTYMTSPRLACGEFLIEHSAFDRVFLCNSGTEAVEAAFKLARKWAYETKGPDCHEVIAFHNGFHGRSMGAASLTYKRDNQPFLGPYVPGINFADFNDLASVEALVTDKTAAIIIEPVQGEGGVWIAAPAFLKALRTLCDEKNIALIFDEIQCGAGRCGTAFAYEQYGVIPDIITLAKGMGGGFPVGAMLAKGDFASHFGHGTHGTTYGGNPLAANVALAVMETVWQPAFLKNVRETGAYLMDQLDGLRHDFPALGAIRGKGLLVGVDMNIPVSPFLKALLQNGVMALSAGENTLRLAPPLIAGRAEVDEAIEILKKTLEETA